MMTVWSGMAGQGRADGMADLVVVYGHVVVHQVAWACGYEER